MALTEFQQEFKKVMWSLPDAYLDFVIGAYYFARTDEKRKEIMQKVKDGTFKDTCDVLDFC